MTDLRTGIDLIEIKRVEHVIHQYGTRFLARIYTPGELEEVGNNTPSLAARFAAKEAVSKALGVGIGKVSWQEIEVLRGSNNEPILSLHGAAARIAKMHNLTVWSISLSHTRDYAMAVVVMTG